MAVRRRIPKPVVAAAIRTAPRVAKTISRAAKGAMPRGTSARVNPKFAKARAAQAKKADAAEGRRRAMAAVSKRRNTKYTSPKQQISNAKESLRLAKSDAKERAFFRSVDGEKTSKRQAKMDRTDIKQRQEYLNKLRKKYRPLS